MKPDTAYIPNVPGAEPHTPSEKANPWPAVLTAARAVAAAALLALTLATPAHAQGSAITQITSNGGDVRDVGAGTMYSTIGEPVASDSIGTVDDKTTWTGFWQITPIGVIAGVREEAGPTAAAETAITWAGPDPFAGELGVRLALAQAAVVELAVHDMFGRRVELLAQGRREAGTLMLRWQPEGLAAGSYLLNLTIDGRLAGSRLVHYVR